MTTGVVPRVGAAWSRGVSRLGLAWLHHRYGQEPVPLGSITRLRRLAGGVNPLSREATATDSALVADAELRRILAGRELGRWSIGPETIARVQWMYQTIKPNLVIDFGSGVSTICIAYLASRSDPGALPSVVALDQSQNYAQQTRDALAASGLAKFGVVIDAPLERVEWDGVSHSTYRPAPEFAAVMDGRKAEMVVIDGPAAESGARYATLPLVRNYLATGARVLLDDALRDGELEAATRWERDGWIDVEGISLVEKGLLLATIVDE